MAEEQKQPTPNDKAVTETAPSLPEPRPLEENGPLWYTIALIGSAIAMLIVGFAVGTFLERNAADEDLEARDQTVIAVQREATSAVELLETDAEAARESANARLESARATSTAAVNALEERSVEEQQAAQETLSAVETQSAEDIATIEADRAATLEAANETATAAIGAVTQDASDRSTATQDAIDAATVIASSFTPTPSETPLPTETSTPSTPEGIVNSVAVPVRLGPGIAFPQIDTLTQDTNVLIVSASDDGLWLGVVYERENEERQGYVEAEAVQRTGGSLQGLEVAADFPSLTPTPSATNTETPIPTASITATFTPSATAIPPTLTSTPENPVGVVDAILTTVYANPSTEAAVLGVLSLEEVVDIVGITADGEWLQITAASLTGWVRSDTLAFTGGNPADVELIVQPTATPSPLPPPIEPTATLAAPVAVASGQFVVVREGPSIVFDAIGVVSASEPLDIVAVSEDGLWFQVVFDAAEDGFGWVSGEVISIAGPFAELPVEAGPALPATAAPDVTDTTETPDDNVDTTDATETPDTIETGDASDGPSSAGSPTAIEPAQLPETLNVDYDNLPGVGAYSYELAVAINGQRDGVPYESFLTVTYTQDDNGNAHVLIDAAGGFESVLSENDLGLLLDFLPVTIGQTANNQSYVYSPSGDLCFDLGAGLDVSEIQTLFENIFTAQDFLFIDDLPADVVFGELETDGLLGIGGNQYQVIGIEQDGEIVPSPDFKGDLWWSEDESSLYGYRVAVNVNDDSLLQYRDLLESLDPSFATTSSFNGDVTVYLLPRAINESAEAELAIPEACDYFITE